MNEFTISAHAWLTFTTLLAGTVFWLGDGFIAERFKVDREMGLGGLPTPDNLPQPPEDPRQVLETAEKSSRIVGFSLLGVGALLALALLARLLI
ncbi:MAG: hypothetical protein R3C27_13445 [Hyphomonadaceae bacterium]